MAAAAATAAPVDGIPGRSTPSSGAAQSSDAKHVDKLPGELRYLQYQYDFEE